MDNINLFVLRIKAAVEKTCKVRDLQVSKGFCNLHFDTNCSYIIKYYFHHRTLTSPIGQNVGPTWRRNHLVFFFIHAILHLP